jgi:hypothetical protein
MRTVVSTGAQLLRCSIGQFRNRRGHALGIRRTAVGLLRLDETGDRASIEPLPGWVLHASRRTCPHDAFNVVRVGVEPDPARAGIEPGIHLGDRVRRVSDNINGPVQFAVGHGAAPVRMGGSCAGLTAGEADCWNRPADVDDGPRIVSKMR